VIPVKLSETKRCLLTFPLIHRREDQCQSHIDPFHPQLEEPLPLERTRVASDLQEAKRAEGRVESAPKICMGRDDNPGRAGEERER
jgi:hypothetical protein